MEPLVVQATGRVPLSGIIDILATPEEAAEYADLKTAAPAPMMWILESPETENERRHRQCRALQDLVWQRALPKLLEGKWTADGFIPGEAERKPISPDIWPELKCDFSKDEAYSAPDLGLHFYRVKVDLRPPPKHSVTAGATRRRLTEWLRDIAQEQREPVRSDRPPPSGPY